MATQGGSSGSNMGGSAGGGMASGGTAGRGTSGGMGRGTGQAGTSDPTYDLISVMYHALQGCQTYERYAQDAEQGGQQDLAQFFREATQENQRRAERGRQLLVQCLQQEQGGGAGQMLQQGGSSGQYGASGASAGGGSMSGASSGRSSGGGSSGGGTSSGSSGSGSGGRSR